MELPYYGTTSQKTELLILTVRFHRYVLYSCSPFPIQGTARWPDPASMNFIFCMVYRGVFILWTYTKKTVSSLLLLPSTPHGQSSFFILWHVDPLLGKDSVNTSPKQRIRSNSRITSVAMQHAVNTTTEEEAFSVWFEYINCWATDVLSMDSPGDYISSPVVNQKPVLGREREWSESSTVKEEGFG
jgi:hypothetical protein